MDETIIVFDKKKENVLMYKDSDNKILSFISGKANKFKLIDESAYFRLQDTAGIEKEFIKLELIRHESVVSKALSKTWSVNVFAGILNTDVRFIKNKENLTWVPIEDVETLTGVDGTGNSLMYLNEAKAVLFRH